MHFQIGVMTGQTQTWSKSATRKIPLRYNPASNALCTKDRFLLTSDVFTKQLPLPFIQFEVPKIKKSLMKVLQ